MDPITEVFTPSRSTGQPYTPSPKLPLPTPPTACDFIRSALATCVKHEINGELCCAIQRVHKEMCVEEVELEN